MIVTVHVQPNAKRSELVSWLDETTIKVKIAAPAVDGKANRALIEFLIELLGARRSELELVRGLTTRMKQIVVPEGLWTAFAVRQSKKNT